MPRLNFKKHHVCLTCYDRISKESLIAPPNPSKTNPAPPSTIDDPLPTEIASLPTISDVLTESNEPQPNAVSVDDTIKQRLAKLKEDRLLNRNHPIDTDKDIAIRIANLKGERFVETSTSQSVLLAVDNRSDQQKSNDLVAQYMSEAKLDEDADPIKDIERRLAALKDIPDKPVGTKDSSISNVNDESESENEEDHARRLVKRYLEEAALEPNNDGTLLTAEEKEFVDSIPKTSDQEELPWCVICNEDASIRYQGDLFCRQCYREVREDE